MRRWITTQGSRNTAPKAQAGVSRADTIRGRKVFYKKVSVVPESDGGYSLQLDGHPLNTPWKNKLVLPTEALAHGVAFEWQNQDKVIEPASMPLMTLSCSTLDGAEENRGHIIESLMRFLDTDTVLFPAHPDEADRSLVKIQSKLWKPLLSWMENEYGHVSITNDIRIGAHPKETIFAVEKQLHDLSPWHLTAMESLVAGCKSMIIPLALLRGHINAKEAIIASRVEEEHQVDAWGLVEGGHDVDRANLATQIAAASFFIRVTPSS